VTLSALDTPGVSVDVDGLLALRHLAEMAPDAMPSTTAMPGGFVQRRRGRGLEVADVRVFEEGDDVRHIDGNATARTGVPHVRTFQDERDRTTLLIADFRAPMLWGTRRAFRSVAAAEQLSLVGWRAIAEGGRVGLMTLGGSAPVFVPARGRERAMISVVGGLAHAHRAAIEAQISGEPVPPEPLDGFLRMAEQIVPRGASVVLASSLDEPGAECEAVMSSLAHRVALSVLHLRDAFEDKAQDGSYPFETSAGRRGLGVVSSRIERSDSDLTVRLPSLGVPVYPIDTSVVPGEKSSVGSGQNGL